jgi:hypothetical protein
MPPMSAAEISQAMRNRYLSLGFVETRRGEWHSPASAIAKQKARRKSRVITVDALACEMSGTRLHNNGGERSATRGHTLGSLRQPCSSHAIAAALSACTMETVVEKPLGMAAAHPEKGCNPMEVADRMMQGLVPGDWRDYMEARIECKLTGC